MEGPVKGDLVVVRFPFSDLSGSKHRPGLVLSRKIGNDIILCQITASRYDTNTVTLDEGMIVGGSLDKTSYIRCNKIFTADNDLIVRKIGRISKEALTNVDDRLRAILDL